MSRTALFGRTRPTIVLRNSEPVLSSSERLLPFHQCLRRCWLPLASRVLELAAWDAATGSQLGGPIIKVPRDGGGVCKGPPSLNL